MTETKPRILVADDERNIRKNLAMVLEAGGYQVDEASDGQEALILCRQTHPDIAFVDLHMPKIEGLDVLAHFRTLSPKTAVVIITAYGSATNAVEASIFSKNRLTPKLSEFWRRRFYFVNVRVPEAHSMT
jgi:CheY-like chemotaxis protein